ARTAIYTLSLHDALPILDTFRNRLQGDEKFDEAAIREWIEEPRPFRETLPELVRTYLKSADPDNAQPAPLEPQAEAIQAQLQSRSEEHTSELQSRFDLVC